MFDPNPTFLHNDPETTLEYSTLNPRQESFCQFYARGGNAARAARLAGYSELSARTQGSRLLKEHSIRRRLAVIREDLREEFAARERGWMDTLDMICRQAVAEGALHPAVRAIEAQARIAKLGISTQPPGPGVEETEAAEGAGIDEWMRRGEANIARCLAKMDNDDE